MAAAILHSSHFHPIHDVCMAQFCLRTTYICMYMCVCNIHIYVVEVKWEKGQLLQAARLRSYRVTSATIGFIIEWNRHTTVAGTSISCPGGGCRVHSP